jgi:hypothetical protein
VVSKHEKPMNPTPEPSETRWCAFEGGTTIGDKGSETGIILLDEEHQHGARITLESGGITAPFSVTCGIYGLFVHTAFAGSRLEAFQKYDAMRHSLDQIISSDEHDVSSQLERFVSSF